MNDERNALERLERWLRESIDGRVMDYLGMSYRTSRKEVNSCTCLLRGDGLWRGYGQTLAAAIHATLDQAGAE